MTDRNAPNGRMPQNVGEVGILSVGHGDTKISFDPNNPQERLRAARIVSDMLRRGYALLIEQPPGSGQYVRATSFREDTCEYVIADFDSAAADEADSQEQDQHEQQAPSPAAEGAAAPAPARRRGRPAKQRSVPAESTRAVGVARVAGG